MSNNKNHAVITFTVVLVTTLIIAGALVLKPKARSDSTQSSTAAQSTNAATVQQRSSTGSPSMTNGSGVHYMNGTYSATGAYDTPEGNESIGVSVTVADDVVTATSAKKMSKSRESRAYQEDFIANYSSFVVGKKLSDIRLGIIAGASLTTIGFNQALDDIRTQAKS